MSLRSPTFQTEINHARLNNIISVTIVGLHFIQRQPTALFFRAFRVFRGWHLPIKRAYYPLRNIKRNPLRQHRFISPAISKRSVRCAHVVAWHADDECDGYACFPAMRLALSLQVFRAHSARYTCSSGHKLLDDAAIRIVRLAAPFGQMSLEMSKETDILHIIRTWQFLDKDGLITGQ